MSRPSAMLSGGRGSALFGLAFAAVLVARVWGDGPAAPPRLSETGLFLPGSTTVDPRNRPFSPQYPLWTDGAAKARWVRLPEGARIDARDADDWKFPVGTRFWKEFAFDGRKVETRMIWRSSAHAWSYATYVWNADQTDAVLAPETGAAAVAEIAPGKWHDIPSIQDCATCHENGRAPVLGFSALQLSDDRDPLAPNADRPDAGAVSLSVLVKEGRFDPMAPELATGAPRIPGDALTRAALGYLSANCGHCHNERSAVATVRMPLRVPAYASLGDTQRIITALTERGSKWDAPHSTPGTTPVLAPGAPEASALFLRMRSRRAASQMPPLGTVVADRAAVDLVSEWIRSLDRRPE